MTPHLLDSGLQPAPSLVVILSGFAQTFGLLPAAILEFNAHAAASNFHLRGPVPTWRLPGEADQFGRLKRGDAADVVLGAIGITFEKVPSDTPLDDDIGQHLAIE